MFWIAAATSGTEVYRWPRDCWGGEADTPTIWDMACLIWSDSVPLHLKSPVSLSLTTTATTFEAIIQGSVGINILARAFVFLGAERGDSTGEYG